jgi:hypothetical protein
MALRPRFSPGLPLSDRYDFIINGGVKSIKIPVNLASFEIIAKYITNYAGK